MGSLISSPMRAVVLTGHGGLDKLEDRHDVPLPEVGPDEVLIQVAACGMNNTDINTRIGWYAKSVTGATSEVIANDAEDGSWGGGLTFPLIPGGRSCRAHRGRRR